MTTVQRPQLMVYSSGEVLKLPYTGTSRKKRLKVGIRIKPITYRRPKRRNRDARKRNRQRLRIAINRRRRRYRPTSS